MCRSQTEGCCSHHSDSGLRLLRYPDRYCDPRNLGAIVALPHHRRTCIVRYRMSANRGLQKREPLLRWVVQPHVVRLFEAFSDSALSNSLATGAYRNQLRRANTCTKTVLSAVKEETH